MNKFSGYEKMPRNLKKIELTNRDLIILEKVKWVVTEKIHGANFSFIYENGHLKYAKRKAYLAWQDDFFGFQLVVNKIEDQILCLFEALSITIKGTKYTLYGELFGGQYPHPKVTPNTAVQAIQTGVYYAPTIHFCAFDIAIETAGIDSKYYLDYQTAISYFEKYNIFFAQPLWTGKLSIALNFDININSIIPKQLGLPELKENRIEGIVIKPLESLRSYQIAFRPIVKIKNAEFEEEKKFHQAQKWSYIPTVSSKAEELSFLIEELKNYINNNRLESAISKIGAFTIGNQQRTLDIKAEFLSDTLTDFNEHNDHILAELSVEQREWMINRVEFEINKVVVDYRLGRCRTEIATLKE